MLNIKFVFTTWNMFNWNKVIQDNLPTDHAQSKLYKSGSEIVNTLSNWTTIYYTNVRILDSTLSLYKSYISPIKYFTTSFSSNKPSFTDTYPVSKSIYFAFFLPQCFSLAISSNQFVEAVLDSSFGPLAFARGICTKVSVNLLLQQNGASTIVGTAKLSGAGVTNCSALCRSLHGHAPVSTSVADPVVIGSVKVEDNFFSLPYANLYFFRCGEKCEILWTFDDMRSSRHCTRDTRAMILQTFVPHSDKELLSPVNVEREVTHVKAYPRDGASETTDIAVGVRKLDVAHTRDEDLLLRISHIMNSIFSSAILTMPASFPIHNSPIRVVSSTREEHFLSHPPPQRPVTSSEKVLHRVLHSFSIELCPWCS